jgi:hypothetical protein
MSSSLSSGAWNYLDFAFDAKVVAFIIFSFCRRLKESHQKKWYNDIRKRTRNDIENKTRKGRNYQGDISGSLKINIKVTLAKLA